VERDPIVDLIRERELCGHAALHSVGVNTGH